MLTLKEFVCCLWFALQELDELLSYVKTAEGEINFEGAHAIFTNTDTVPTLSLLDRVSTSCVLIQKHLPHFHEQFQGQR